MTVVWRTDFRLWRWNPARRSRTGAGSAGHGDGSGAAASRPTLGDLAPGEQARITAVLGDDLLAQRMMQLGLLPGADVELVRRAPAGDPIEIRVMGYALSLRAAEARMVSVERRR